MAAELPGSVRARVDRERDHWRRRLEQLVAIPSVSARGENLTEAAEFVAKLGEEAGLDADIACLPDAAPVVVLSGGGGGTLLFYNHYDVQPPEPLSEWISPPFDLTPREGCLFGRGVADNKGDLIARLAAVSAWQAAGGPPCGIAFLVEGEEEVGSGNLERYVKDLSSSLAAEVCLWESGNRSTDGALQISFGVKGCLYIELSVAIGSHDLHSSWATLVSGAPVRLVSALASMVDQDGGPAIDGYREAVIPPGQLEVAAASRLAQDDETLARELGVSRLRAGGGTSTERHLFLPTVNIAGISAGYQGPGSKTVLPARASAKLDLRLVPGLSWSRTLELVQLHLERRGFTDIEVEVLGAADPYRSSLDDPRAGLVAGVARDVYGSEPVLIPTLAGTGPMQQVLGEHKPMCCSAGVSYAGSLIHAPNEHVREEDLDLGTLFVAALMHELGRNGETR